MGQAAEVLVKAKKTMILQSQRIRAQDAQIKELAAELHDKSGELQQRAAELAGLTDQLRQQEESIQEKHREVESLREQLLDDQDREALAEVNRMLSPDGPAGIEQSRRRPACPNSPTMTLAA